MCVFPISSSAKWSGVGGRVVCGRQSGCVEGGGGCPMTHYSPRALLRHRRLGRLDPIELRPHPVHRAPPHDSRSLISCAVLRPRPGGKRDSYKYPACAAAVCKQLLPALPGTVEASRPSRRGRRDLVCIEHRFERAPYGCEGVVEKRPFRLCGDGRGGARAPRRSFFMEGPKTRISLPDTDNFKNSQFWTSRSAVGAGAALGCAYCTCCGAG